MDVLKLILKDGFWPRYCGEDVRWIGQEGMDFVAFPSVCFCDIPLARIDEHVSFYGEYGLGLPKEWAMVNGLNPVQYLSGSNELTRQIKMLNEHASAKATMRYIKSHAKPIEGNMIVSGKPVLKEFYQESEWRYVPTHENVKAYISGKALHDTEKTNTANLATKEHCMLKFSPGDIKYIFVKSDSDIPEVSNFIQVALESHPAAAVKILLSRVISLESIRRDL